MKKRVIAFLLSVCLSFSICAGTAFAEEPANTVDQIEKQAEVSIDPVAADEEEPSSTPDDSEVLTPVPAPAFSEGENVEKPADEIPAEDEPEITVPDAEAPAEDVLPDENIGDTTEITDDMSEEEEFEEEESELGTYEGDTMATAKDLPTNTTQRGTFSSSTEHCSYWYRLNIPQQGTISATLSHEYIDRSSSIIDFYFVDSKGKNITSIYSSALNSMETEIPSIGIAPGTYYLRIDHDYYYQHINYRFKVNYTICDNYEIERNDTINEATTISPNKTYTGRTNYSNDIDYYKITAPSDGYFAVNFEQNVDGINSGSFIIQLWPENMKHWLDSRDVDNSPLSDINVGIQKGVYYFKVIPKYYGTKDSGLYSFSLKFTKSSTYEKELNDDEKSPTTIPLNATISGAILGRSTGGYSFDDVDWFKFTASKKTYYTIHFTPRALKYRYNLTLTNANWKTIDTLSYEINHSSDEDYRIVLEPGTYYIKITVDYCYYTTSAPYDFYVKQSTVTPSPVTDFVSRLYKYCLNRDPDDSGLSYWASLLSRKELTGAQVAQNFVFSPEFLQQNIDNDKFVDRLYLAFFGRESDRDGRYYWTGRLSRGMSRRTVAANFINSTEFLNICNSYGIVRGSVGSSGTSATRSQIEAYVKRCYTQILGRSGDSDGINYWTTLIQNGQSRPVDVAKSFVGSREFSLKQLNNTEFVKVMYRAFMGREYDTGGLNYWVNQMNRGMSKNEVLNNFANSKEFSLIMNSMGV